VTIAEAVEVTGTRTGEDVPGTWLGGRFRLDERVTLDERVSTAGGPGTRITAAGLSVWKATDELLGRPVTVHLLPRGTPVPPHVVDAVRSAARVSDPRLATIYDTDFTAGRPYIVSEWARGTHLEDLVRTGLPHPALAAAMIADAADALAVAHRARRPHLRLTPHTLRWHPGTGLKITGLGLDAALFGRAEPGTADPVTADTTALARMLYALLTGYWPGDDATALPPAPRHKGSVCTPRQVRAGVPAILDAITHRGLLGQAADAPLRAQTPAGLAMALRLVQRPSYRLEQPEEEAGPEPYARAQARQQARKQARHARPRAGFGRRTALLRPAV
jgi:hypothetical protein